MKHMARVFMLFGVIVIGSGLYAPDVDAHGTAYRIIGDATVATIEFVYSDQEPMQYAEVLVYSPKDKRVEFQNGRTDRNGRFSFCPDVTGSWRILVKDGTGHNVQSKIEVIKDSTGRLEICH